MEPPISHSYSTRICPRDGAEMFAMANVGKRSPWRHPGPTWVCSHCGRTEH